MRNITVFTVLVIILNCAQCPLYGQDTQEEKQVYPYGSTVSTKFGLLAGQAEEIVYPSSLYQAAMLSQLLWDMKPVFYYGLSMDFARAQPFEKWGFFSTLSLKNGVPGKSGKMEDRDWASIENKALTHFSVHDNYTDWLFFMDIAAGFSFPIKHVLLLKPYITLSYMHFDFSGRYGHGTYARQKEGANSGMYAPIDDSPDYHSFANWERVINYTQEWITVSPGISFSYHFLDHFLAEVFFQISPLVFCNDLDEHLTTNTQYRDYMSGGLYLEPGFHFSFFDGKRLNLSLEFSWRYINGTRGETYMGSPIGTASYVRAGEAGAGLSVIDTGLCLKIHL